jgi:hypothetical protein
MQRSSAPPMLSLTSPSSSSTPRPIHAPCSSALEARRLRTALAASASSATGNAHSSAREREEAKSYAADEAQVARLAAEAWAIVGRAKGTDGVAHAFLRAWSVLSSSLLHFWR